MINDLISLQCEKYCIGGIIKNPEIFPDVDSWVKEDTFGQSTHKVIWGVIRQILLKNESPTPTLIAQRISNLNIKTKDDISIFDYLNAISFSQITAQGTLDNFKELVKLKVLRELVVSADNAKKFVLENKNKEIKEIVSGVDAINNEKIVSLYKNIDEEVKDIFIDAEQVIEGLGNNPPDPESFIMGPFESVNKLYGSLNKPSNITVVAARSGSGKAQPIWCKVLSEFGWVELSSLKVGDKIYGSNGKLTNILGIFPQGKQDYYKITLDDGDFTHSTLDHLWFTKTYRNRKSKRDFIEGSVKTLREISESLIDKHGGTNHSIEWIKPIESSEKIFKLDPYLLGCLLGNGSLSSGTIKFSSIDKSIINRINKILSPDSLLRKEGLSTCDWRIVKKDHNPHNNWLFENNRTKIHTSISEMGLLNTSSFSKFIPSEYFLGSINQRLELLRGLLDTDGYVTPNTPSIEYSTSSEQLKNGIVELVKSLGGRATCVSRYPKYTYKGKKLTGHLNYRIMISFLNDFVPFNSEYKIKNFKKMSRQLKRYIKSVTFVGKDECLCIKVDAQDSLYVTDNYILTHNTSLSMYHQVMVAQKYKLPLLWLDFGEMTAQELQMRSIVMMTKGEVPLWSLETGQWRQNPEWVKTVRSVWQKVKDIKFYYQDVSKMGPQETISFIRRFSYNKVGRDNPFLVVYDYFKPFETHSYNTPEWKQMGHFMQDIKSFINNELPIPFWAAVQLNRSGITTNKSSEQVDDSENSIGMSDRITQQCSHALILRYKTMDEIAVEENKFGNMKLIAVKHRHLGRDYLNAIRPVKIGKRFLKNHINLDGGSFYYEDRGDLNHAAAVLKEQYELIEGEKNETL